MEQSLPAPHVRVAKDAVVVDGRPSWLLGGEFQYFRVRDRRFDGPSTHALWGDRLDQLRSAGLDLVSTYIPWDYHAPGPGTYDFTGARDVGRFFDMAAERGFRIVVKPGPHILAEWPYGFGSWGAIPRWWTRANPEELVRDRKGRIFRWNALHPRLGPRRNALPSYGSEAFLEATSEWFRAVLPTFRDHLGPGGAVIGLQLDNETNFFWSDIYRIDHHPEQLARFRRSLEERYTSLAAMSVAHGRTYRSLEEVRPPVRSGEGTTELHRDWIAHLHATVEGYLGRLRGNWEDLGVREPDVLFLTNDTPQAFPFLRDILLPHGPSKNRHGLHAMDTYPRGMGVSRPGKGLFDNPFEPDFHCKLYDRWNDIYTGPSRFVFGIEIQGGLFSIPIGPPGFRISVAPNRVSPEATRQTGLRLMAHGMKAMAFYVLVGGRNLDGSAYDFQAALGIDGRPRPRFREIRHLAEFVRRHEQSLLRSRAVESSVAVVADSSCLGPGGGRRGEQRIFGEELRGVFGWCASAGFTPDVIDLAIADADELSRFKALLYPASGLTRAENRRKLAAYVEAGGHLVQMLGASPENVLFPLDKVRTLKGRSDVRFDPEGTPGSVRVDLSGVESITLPTDAQVVLGLPGAGPETGILGYERSVGRGRATYLATTPGSNFARRGLYSMRLPQRLASRDWIRTLLQGAAVAPLFHAGPGVEVHGRIDAADGRLFLFVFSNGGPGGGKISFVSLEPFGWGLSDRVRVFDGLASDEADENGETPAPWRAPARPVPVPRSGSIVTTGEALGLGGIDVELGSVGSAVVVLQNESIERA